MGPSRGSPRRRGSVPPISLLRCSLLRFFDSRYPGSMDMIIPPLTNDIMLESNPLKSFILVRILAIRPIHADRTHTVNVCVYIYIYMYIYIYTHVYVCMYIYIYREREREREIYTCNAYMCISHVPVYCVHTHTTAEMRACGRAQVHCTPSHWPAQTRELVGAAAALA